MALDYTNHLKLTTAQLDTLRIPEPEIRPPRVNHQLQLARLLHEEDADLLSGVPGPM